jgi:hypothetical protein
MFTKPDDPEQIRDFVSDALSLVYEGLLLGAYKAQEYFDDDSNGINFPLAANIARYHAKQYVKSNRRLDAPYWFGELPNNSIEIRQDWCLIKVLKGRNGEPPTASNTIRSREFYHQSQPTLPGITLIKVWKSRDWKEFIKQCTFLNLILCWEVDFSYSISKVQLMCPRQSGRYWEGVRTFWRLPVAHPVMGIKDLPTVDEEQEVEDLPVFFQEYTAEQNDNNDD